MSNASGFPELTDSFLAGQDILYTQFNDVSFYVEDTDQEHLYFNIFKRLFNNVQFTKIFPLHGKTNLKTHAKDNIADKSKIYIADIDFENILETKEEIEGVFYLNRYSIENFLIEKSSLFELIREKKPRLKDIDIQGFFDFNSNLQQCKILLSELTCTFIIIQKYSLGKEYFGLNPGRDLDFSTTSAIFKNSFISTYFDETEQILKAMDGRFSLKSKQKELKKHVRSLSNALINIPGKYLLIVIKHQLEKAKLINQMSLETLTYKLSKECSLTLLNDLKVSIENYRT